MNNTWKTGSISTNYYHDENGKILGKVSRNSYSDDIWSAYSGPVCLGEYVDEKSARKAVEAEAVSITVTFDSDSFEIDSPFCQAQDIDFPMDYHDSDITIDLSIQEEKPKKKKKK